MSQFSISHGKRSWNIENPSECPICHYLIVVEERTGGSVHIQKKFADIAYRCPNPDCTRWFIGHYNLLDDGSAELIKLIPHEPTPEEIPPIAEEISPNFVSIYKEAKEARESGLVQICGPGFRKAFEFLIKDYAKQLVTTDEEKKTVENSFSGTVVNSYIGDARIQAVAQRALWLGNDEAHYLRKWKNHDIEDLVTLISLTIHWIEIEQLSKKYVDDMPDSSK